MSPRTQSVPNVMLVLAHAPACLVAGERQFLFYVQGEQSRLLPVTRTKGEERADG